MLWRLLLIALFSPGIVACSNAPAASEQVLVTQTRAALLVETLPPPSDTPVPTVLPPTATPVPTLPPTVPAAGSACTVRNEWPVYTVVAGDTLYSIASRTGSSVEELTRSNCLTDAGLISVGQELHVPILPEAGITDPDGVVPSGDGPGITTVGTIRVTPVLNAQGSPYTVEADTVLNVTWEGLPSDDRLSQVEFVFTDETMPRSPISAGLDTDLSDGASINWALTPGMRGTLYAAARLPGQQHEGYISESVRITTVAAESTQSQGGGTIRFAPIVSSEPPLDYILHSDVQLTVTWDDMPRGQGIAQVEFLYVDADDPTRQLSIGIDSNLADGVSVIWQAPQNLRGAVYAVGRIPGQTHSSVQSQHSHIETVPFQIGPLGALSVDPNIQAGTPDDWTDYVVEPGATVTLRWTGVDPQYYAQLRRVEFQYIPDTGGIQVLGSDTETSDGLSLSWVVPAEASGRIRVGGASSGDASYIYAPEIHVRTPETIVTPCEFNPFGIGGPVPVYPIPNTDTGPIRTIEMGETYPVLGTGGTWSTEFGGQGTFYHLDFGDASGWVQDARGELIGDCLW